MKKTDNNKKKKPTKWFHRIDSFLKKNNVKQTKTPIDIAS
jgi:hypothetical protein